MISVYWLNLRSNKTEFNAFYQRIVVAEFKKFGRSKQAKDQLISKGLFGIIEFLKKTVYPKNEQTNLVFVIRQKKRICSFVFWRNRLLEKIISNLSDL